MTQKQMVNAYLTLTQLSSAKLPVVTAYALYQLRKRLEPSYAFCVEQEQVIIEQHNGVIENGVQKFEDAETAQQVREELSALNSMEVEYTDKPLQIDSINLESAVLSIDDIAALDGFVELV